MSILFIAPYPDLVKTASETLKNTPYPVKIILGDLYTGVEKAKQEISDNQAQIVISRGGTASLLRQRISLPVFEIDVTGFDLLRAIYPHAAEKKKIAVIGYENVISGAKGIAEITKTDLGYFLITENSHIESIVKEADLWGADVIVGDTVSVSTAEKLGLKTEIVRSGPEAILSTVEAASNFIEHMNYEILRNKRLDLIMEHSDWGVLYLNADGVIELLNSTAEQILQRKSEMIIGSSLSSGYLPPGLVSAIEDRKSNKLIQLNDKSYMIEILEINNESSDDSTLVFIQSSSRIKNLEEMLRKQMVIRGHVASYSFKNMIGNNELFVKTIEKAKKYSKTDSTILLLGETGSGKEFFAQSIHNASARKNGPFIAVNCAALPDSLLESELFGYAEGAFTGAKKGGKSGLFEMAHKGTIFLDEINDISNSVQSRFLRVLQEKQVMRIGDTQLYDIDVRIIAACNKDLFEETEAGRFRKDLYYRLKVLDIKLPPLRERREDILLHFRSALNYFTKKYSYSNIDLPEKLTDAITRYNWPGNIRQLRNFAEKTCVLFSLNQDHDEISEDLINDLLPESMETEERRVPEPLKLTESSIKETKAEMIYRCWEENERNTSKTARQLGLNRATVRKYLESCRS